MVIGVEGFTAALSIMTLESRGMSPKKAKAPSKQKFHSVLYVVGDSLKYIPCIAFKTQIRI